MKILLTRSVVPLLIVIVFSALPAASQEGYVAHFEGENLVRGAISTGGRVWQQPMQNFGRSWSGNKQLSWVPPRPGGRLDLTIEVKHSGNYRVAGYFTFANNCGNFQMAVNGKRLGKVVNAYDPGVVRSERIEFGDVTLREGRNTISFHMVGKDPRSIGWVLGIDGLAFDRMAPRPIERPDLPVIDNKKPPPVKEIPQVRPPSREPSSTETVDPQGDLLVRLEKLKRHFTTIKNGSSWRAYLQIDELKSIVSQNPPREQAASAAGRLRETAQLFDSVSRDPRYRAIHQSKAYQDTHQALQVYNSQLQSFSPDMPKLTSGSVGAWSRLPESFHLNTELLEKYRRPELKVWNGNTGDFEFYEEMVVVTQDNSDASNWRFRWKHDLENVDRAIWQATRFEPAILVKEWQDPAGLVATGEIAEVPQKDQYSLFNIDLNLLAGHCEEPTDSEGSTISNKLQIDRPTADPARATDGKPKLVLLTGNVQLTPSARMTRKSFQKLNRQVFYIRLVALNSSGAIVGYPSETVKVSYETPQQPDFVFYAGTVGPDKSDQVPKVEADIHPLVQILEFAPIHERDPQADLHWIVTKENFHGWPKGKHVEGELQDLLEKSTWEKIKGTAGDAAEFIKDAANWASEAYSDIKKFAVNSVASAIPGCGGGCKDVLSAGLDYGLTAVGVPPSIPNFDQLAEMSKGHIKEVVAAEVADLAEDAGVPSLVTDKITQEVIDELVDNVINEATKLADSPWDDLWLKPDPDYERRPAYIRVAIRNPSETHFSGTLHVRIKNDLTGTWDRLFKDIRLPIPNMPPGTTKEIPVVLEEDIEPWYKPETQSENENRTRMGRRYWDNYYDPRQSMTLRVELYGHAPIGTEEAPKLLVFQDRFEIQQSARDPYPKP